MKTENGFDKAIEKGCGIVVHRKQVIATLMGLCVNTQTCTFSLSTLSLVSLREWLLKQGITHVMIESNNDYCKLVYNFLYDHLTVFLVNQLHSKSDMDGATETITIEASVVWVIEMN